ncbi:ARP2/3 actin-organizing complex subunit Sop2 [Hypoxylon texense]
MDLGKGSHSPTNASSYLQRETNPGGLAAIQSAEYDEIPLDFSSEESQSSNASMSDSDSDDEAEARHSSLISTGHEHVPIQPRPPAPTMALVHVPQQDQVLSRKRKYPGTVDTISHPAVSAKKVKLDEKHTACPLDKSLLPAEIWHRIFTFTPPRTLGNLLCVNKLFNAYLIPQSSYRYIRSDVKTRCNLATFKKAFLAENARSTNAQD